MCQEKRNGVFQCEFLRPWPDTNHGVLPQVLVDAQTAETARPLTRR